MAGKPFFDAIFEYLNCTVLWEDESGVVVHDGRWLDPQTVNGHKRLPIATLEGPVCNILRGERTALNVLARCSGIATRAFELTNLARQHHWQGRISGTRKTTPVSISMA